MPDDFAAPAEQDTPDAVDEAPDTGQAEETQEGSFLDSFNLDDVPADARPHVEALQKQWQSSYTKTRQAEKAEIEEARREAEEAKQFQEGMANPELLPFYLKQMGYDLSDPQVLGQFGYELAEDEGEEEWQDPTEQLAGRMGQLEAQLQQQAEEKQQAQYEQEVENYIGSELSALDPDESKYDAEDVSFITKLALANPDARGVPDVKGAAKHLDSFADRRQEKFIASKKSGRPPSSGIDAERPFDPMNREERQAAMAQAAAEAEASGL